MTDTLVTYVRDKEGKPVACFVGNRSQYNQLYVGWSKYAKNKEKKSYIKKEGVRIAKARMVKHNGGISGVPHSLRKDYIRFIKRCKKYFKQLPEDT